MAPSDIADVDVNKLMEQLTTDEVIMLTAGSDFWHTCPIPRLGIPAIKVSDGPNGIKGSRFFMATPTKCLPSATALGATWDPELIEQAGYQLLANEAKLKAAAVILAPTCNIQRNPLGGRSFESFSEDPILSGHITAAYVKGVQENHIGTTIKHFVCNDKEDDRNAYDSILSERALREIYLMPFMITQKYAKPWCYMTAYNRVNGLHASESPYLLRDILRNEWKFNGMIMSDWFGVYSNDLSINAGLDLEMPGINNWRTTSLTTRSIKARKIMIRTLKERAKKVVELVQRVAQESPDILDGDGIERSDDSEEDRELMRNLAAESIVLLKNDGDLLPLQPRKLSRVAIVGGNAKAVVLSGGGSAALKPSYFISPYQGIVNALPADVEVTYSEGATTYLLMPTLEKELTTPSGEFGWICTWYAHESDESMVPKSEPYRSSQLVDETLVYVGTDVPEGIARIWTVKLVGLLTRDHDCTFEFGLGVAGRAKLFVDGELVIDNWTRQTRGTTFLGTGTIEERMTVELKADVAYDVLVEFCNVRGPADGDEDETILDSNSGVRLGGAEVRDPDDMMTEAVQLAGKADVVIAVVGLNGDWESESVDRTTLALPGRTDELVSKVLAANPNTVVVTQAGSAITMPWVDSAPAIVHSWYLGNATGDAIADVLFGKKNPSGKLSLTFPKRLEDVPAHGHFHSENGALRYGEDLFVGYKHYQFREIDPLFAFGHGLSYTQFEFYGLELSAPVCGDDFSLTVELEVKNVGHVTGSEVVQLYVSMPAMSAVTHPPRSLRAFKKVKDLESDERAHVTLTLDKIAVSWWDQRIARWVIERGTYGVSVGPSSDVLPLSATFEVDGNLEWTGL